MVNHLEYRSYLMSISYSSSRTPRGSAEDDPKFLHIRRRSLRLRVHTCRLSFFELTPRGFLYIVWPTQCIPRVVFADLSYTVVVLHVLHSAPVLMICNSRVCPLFFSETASGSLLPSGFLSQPASPLFSHATLPSPFRGFQDPRANLLLGRG